MKHLILLTIASLLIVAKTYAQNGDNESARIYMSQDFGRNWREADSGFPKDDWVNSWAVNNAVIYAGTENHGVMISTDKAKTWIPASKGLPIGVRVKELLAVNGIVYAGTYLNGIFMSVNDGLSWMPCSTGLLNFTIRGLFRHNNVLYAGTNEGIYTSTNQGSLWRKLEVTPTSAIANPYAVKIAYNKSNNTNAEGVFQVNSFSEDERTLYVATNRGVIRSFDHGKTWEQIFKGTAIQKIAVSKTEIALLDYEGVVYVTPKEKIMWLRDEIFFPSKAYFQLTPTSPKLLRQPWARWMNTIYSPNNGLPAGAHFINLTDTPVGWLVSTGMPGC